MRAFINKYLLVLGAHVADDTLTMGRCYNLVFFTIEEDHRD